MSATERQETFAEVADMAFGAMLDFIESDKGKQQLAALGRGKFVREFATLRLNMGRQTGKTRWLVESAARSDVILVGNEAQARELIHRFKELDRAVPYVIPAEHVVNVFKGVRWLDKIGETIWVDDASYLDQAKLNDAINEIAIHIKPEHIVFLG